MSATTILETAPLGALIRYSDGSPRPPARFTKKLAAWERSNGEGRLVKKEPPRPYWVQLRDCSILGTGADPYWTFSSALFNLSWQFDRNGRPQ